MRSFSPASCAQGLIVALATSCSQTSGEGDIANAPGAVLSEPGVAAPEGAEGVPATETMVPQQPESTLPAAPMPSPPAAPEGPTLIINDSEGAQTEAGFLPSEKVDLLLVVDNSASMADKQEVLKKTIPDLLRFLAEPPCLNPATQAFEPVNDQGFCSSGERVFGPVDDIHLGLISSSLGSHGATAEESADGCLTGVAEQDDQAHLIGLKRPDLDTNQNLGFLAWDPNQQQSPPGESNFDKLVSDFEAQVDKVGESGCGFEAPLEAAYRFLIDPAPHAELTRVPCVAGSTTANCVEKTGVDQALLDQRGAFLRDDSVVVVMFLTDENDCSIRESRQGFFAVRPNQPLRTGTSACEQDPNDACCHSCSVQSVPQGCEANPMLNGCAVNTTDAPQEFNLRCYDQERRFGFSMLHDVRRYIDGFTNPRIAPEGEVVSNPLFTEERDASKIFVAGIVGMPWQDTATSATLTEADDLRLRKVGQDSSEPDDDTIDWSLLLPSGGEPARDPFMAESRSPRTGEHPLTGDVLGGPGSVNSINGHDRIIGPDETADLQYACTFPLSTPRDCTLVGEGESCDCVPGEDLQGNPLALFEGNPLCRDPDTGTYGTTQFHAKAYPGTRILQVLQGVGQQSVVASICPEQTSSEDKSNFGYRPVIRALLLNAQRQIVR